MWDWLSSVSATSWFTIAAIIIGPIAAVRIEKLLETQRERTRRRMDLFRTLMLHRASPLASENVAALNSINLVFAGAKFQAVRRKWKALLNHYNNGPHPDLPGFAEMYVVWVDKANDLTRQLLQEMGLKLGFQFDDVEMQTGVYAPKGHFDDETANKMIRDELTKILQGQQELGIRIVIDDAQAAQSHKIGKTALEVLEGSRALSVKLDDDREQ